MIRAKSARRFVVSGTVTSFAAVVFVKVFGLLESIVVARLLGDVRFGLLILVLSVTNLVLACGSLGLPPALMKFLSGEAAVSREAAWGTIRKAFGAVLLGSAASALLFGIVEIQFLLPNFQEAGPTLLLVLGTLLICATAPLALFGNALQGLGRVGTLNLRAALGAVVGLALAIPLTYFLGTLGAFVALVSGTAFIGASAFPTVRKIVTMLPSAPKMQDVSVRALLNYGLPTLFSGLIVLFAFYWINSLLARGSGFGDLGAFAVAWTLANVITLLSSAIGVPLIPLLSSLSVGDPRRGRAVVAKVLRLVVFLSLPLVLGGVCFSNEILALTYGPQFTRGSTLLSILALSSFFASLSGIVGNQIAGVGKMWWGLGINMTWAATIIVTSSWLIPSYGAIGASLSILVAYAGLACVALYVGRRVLQVNVSGVATPAAWAAMMLILSFVIAFFAGNWRLLSGILLLIATLVSMVSLFNPSERLIVKDLLLTVVMKKKSGGGT